MKRRTGTGTLLGALALAAFAAVPAQVDDETRTGTFHVVWRDLPDRPAGERYFLVDDAGRAVALELDAADAAPHGGVLKLNGRRVTVRGTLRTAAAGGGAPRLAVESLRADVGGARFSVSGAPQSGSKAYVTILCRFADRPGSDAQLRSVYAEWMGGSYPGLDHYWRELSEERINLEGTRLVGPYVLPRAAGAYLSAPGQANLGLLAEDCTRLADPDVDFGPFVGINMQFNGDLGGYSWGGGWTLALDGPLRRFATTWMADWATQATYAHEIGHSLGLPHSSGPYEAVYDSRWDVMSGGGSTDVLSGTRVAPHTIAYHKDLLGWVPPARKYVAPANTSATLVLERGALPPAGGYQMAEIPIVRGGGAFFTVETRRVSGYDAPGRLPGEAVVIHRVTPGASSPARVVDVDGNGNPNDAGAQWVPGETYVDVLAGVQVRVLEQTATGFRVEISTLGGLAVQADSLRPEAVMGSAYSDQLTVANAPGDVAWSLSSGQLPAGLTLSANGAITGVPAQAGGFFFTASVTSAGAFGIKGFALIVRKPQLERDGVVDQLLGSGSPLTPDQVRFLDLLGNRNGRLDVGDVRVWLEEQGHLNRPAVAPPR